MSRSNRKNISDRTFNAIGDALKKARTDAGLTQKELADAIGTRKQHVYKWESGINAISMDYLERISEILPNFTVTFEKVTSKSNLGFDSRLRQARETLNLKFDDLAEELGLTPESINEAESGEGGIPANLLVNFRKLGINDEWLATGQGSMLIAPAQADRRSLADRLKVALKHRNKTQAELASGIGATDSQVSLWISGEHEPRGKNRHAIATFLNINEAWLRTGAGPMDPADDYGAPGVEAETEVDRRMAQRSSQKDDVNRISQTIDAIASLLSVNSPRLKDNPVLVWQATELLKSLNAALRDLINEKGGGQSPDRDR